MAKRGGLRPGDPVVFEVKCGTGEWVPREGTVVHTTARAVRVLPDGEWLAVWRPRQFVWEAG
jgi:hypothetical protein